MASIAKAYSALTSQSIAAFERVVSDISHSSLLLYPTIPVNQLDTRISVIQRPSAPIEAVRTINIRFRIYSGTDCTIKLFF